MKSNQPRNQLRIIAGTWRGRKLGFAPVPGVRPTPDRVRETLFNWLAGVVSGARCLDLYAGSGALGLEAASRGAAEVILVDSDPVVARTLREQLRRLNADQVRVVECEAGAYLRGPAEPFDVVFLDPPFREQRLQEAIHQLEAGDWLTAEAWVYLETERELALPLPPNWVLYRSKTAGQVAYHLVRRHPPV